MIFIKCGFFTGNDENSNYSRKRGKDKLNGKFGEMIDIVFTILFNSDKSHMYLSFFFPQKKLLFLQFVTHKKTLHK